MKRIYLPVLASMLGISAIFAQDVILPEGMSAISTEGMTVTTVDELNRSKCEKPLVRLGNGVVFSAATEALGEELYIYKDNRLSLIKDIVTGSEGSNPRYMTVVGDKVFFTAATAENGSALWVTDGTEAGTVSVMEFDAMESTIFGLTAVNGKCLFFARDIDSELSPIIDSMTEEEWLWASDGTTAGTTRIADTPTRKNMDGLNGYIVPVGDKAFFVGYDPVNNESLWVTDGTKNGTHMVKNINPNPADIGTNFETAAGTIDWLYNVNDEKVIFRATAVSAVNGTDSDWGVEPWVSDGTEAGTYPIADYAPGERNGVPNNSEFAYPIHYQGKVYFRGRDGVHGCEPSVTDFTAQGTHYVYDINWWNNNPNTDSWGLEGPCIYKGFLFGKANGSYYWPEGKYHDSGYGLWRYDLSENGQIVSTSGGDGTLKGFQYEAQWLDGGEIFPGDKNGSQPRWLTVCADKLFFSAQSSNNNLELWQMDDADATPANVVDMEGNTSPYALTAAGGSLYFVTSTTKQLYRYVLEENVGFGALAAQAEGTIAFQPDNRTLSIASEQAVHAVYVYDQTGAACSAFTGNSKEVSLAHLPAGLYIVKVCLDNGNCINDKIICR